MILLIKQIQKTRALQDIPQYKDALVAMLVAILLAQACAKIRVIITSQTLVAPDLEVVVTFAKTVVLINAQVLAEGLKARTEPNNC